MSEDVRWQGMGSAPRDGTRILVTVRASEQGEAAVDTAFWDGAARTREAAWRAADSHADCVVTYREGELLGWMPLPQPGAPARPRPMTLREAAEADGSGI